MVVEKRAGTVKRPLDLRGVSYGSPAAIVTSMALIVGLQAATASKAAVIGSLLIIGIADNLTDSLSVHIYQESERMAERRALTTTLTNFVARLAVACSFILLFLLASESLAIWLCVIWGFVLLSALSYFLAKARNAAPISEMVKHSGVAVVVIFISRAVGLWIQLLMR